MLRTRTSSTGCPLSSRLWLFARHSSSSEHGSRAASSRLWADAIEEETVEAGSNTKAPTQLNEYPNWTGDESVEDAVLRMLIDKYKPLRGGSVKTAEEKLKFSPPTLAPESVSLSTSSETPVGSALGTDDAHRPWLTTFRTPSHASSIRYMRLPPLPPPSKSSAQQAPIHPDDTRARILDREKKKKAAHIGRLTNARESSLDYRIGKTTTAAGDPRMHRPNPVSVKGWTSLVEERIERARSEGHFRSIRGRGKPLAHESEHSNPFIPREEFLMNRIVQRQGAAPPWVEIQGELETAVNSFRGVLQSAWTRRIVRSLMLEHPLEVLSRLTLSDVTGRRVRDHEWESREEAYHQEALREVNALVRKYNGVAPYSVRRTYLTREAELERMYTGSGEDILAELRRKCEVRPAGDLATPGRMQGEEGGAGAGQGGGGVDDGEMKPIGFGLRVIWNRWVAKFIGG